MRQSLACIFVAVLRIYPSSAAFQVQSDVMVPPPLRRDSSGGVSVAPPPPMENDYYQREQASASVRKRDRRYQANDYLDNYSGSNRIEYGYGTPNRSSNSRAPQKQREQQFVGLRPTDEEFVHSSRVNNVQYGGKRHSAWNEAQQDASDANYMRYQREPRAETPKKAACQHFRVDGFIDDTKGSNRMEFGGSYGGAHQDSRSRDWQKEFNPNKYVLVHQPDRTPKRQQSRRRSSPNNYGSNSVGEANQDPSNPADHFDPSKYAFAPKQHQPRRTRPARLDMQYGSSYGGNDVAHPAQEYNPARYATLQRQSRPARPAHPKPKNNWQRYATSTVRSDVSNPAEEFDPSKYAMASRPRTKRSARRYEEPPKQEFLGGTLPDNNSPADDYDPSRYEFVQKDRPVSSYRRYQNQRRRQNEEFVPQDLFTARKMADPNGGFDAYNSPVRYVRYQKKQPDLRRRPRDDRYDYYDYGRHQEQMPLSAGEQFAHQTTNSHGYTAGQYGYGNF